MTDAGVNELEALRLMLEWGADEALLDSPVDRFAVMSDPVQSASTVRADAPTVPQLVSKPALVARPTGVALAEETAAAATDLAALYAAMDGFVACPLRATASCTIAPSGNPAAGLVLVYDSPGAEDDRSGRAFSGVAGERLDRILASAGLDRTMLLAVPLVAWRAPGGRPVSDAELAQSLPFLHRLLVLTGPRRLVLLGAGPYRAMAGDEGGFRKARGKWSNVGIPGLAVVVPAFPMLSAELWLSSPANRQATWTDLLTLTTTLKDI